MSYLKFDKRLMINLEQSLPKEMLRTNQSGAYHCTTVVDCNTRKQHGLLVVPLGEGDYNPHVLLSSLDETVIQHGAAFNLGLHRYHGGVYSPNGHKYIREFDCESVPRTTYRVGGVILTKEKIFIQHENRILIRYTLVDAHSPTTLQFRPFLAFRESNALCIANDRINTECTPCDNGVSCCLYPGYPTLFMQLTHKPEFIYKPDWYHNIEYVKDLDRGVPYCEDLWVPGYFQVNIRKGESIIFSAGLSEVKPRALKAMYEAEIASRIDSIEKDIPATKEMEKTRHKMVYDITSRLEAFSLNTVVSGFMEYTNKLIAIAKQNDGAVDKETIETVTILLAPFVPHIAEEIWEKLGHEDSIFHAQWPAHDEELMKDDEIEVPVQINGKTKAVISIPAEISKEDAIAEGKKAVADKISGNIIKEIYVPKKIINIVVK